MWSRRRKKAEKKKWPEIFFGLVTKQLDTMQTPLPTHFPATRVRPVALPITHHPTIRLFFKVCKDKKLLTFLFINSSHFTRAASGSSTVKLSQSSEVWTGCHCNHFLHKHTSHCWLPRWEASRDIGTLNIGRRRVGVRQHQFKPWPTTTHHPGNKLAGWLHFTGLSVAEC